MSIVEIKNLTKTYGDIKAVDDFNLTAEKGEILALVGPDGAGKTSIFRASCGLIRFDGGKIEIAGYDVSCDFEKVKPLLGYMPQVFSLYPDLTVEENLNFYAGLYGVTGDDFKQKRDVLYDFSGLKPFRKRWAGNLSGGMKQKLALSCALVHDPEVLILDEPTTGVDALSRRQFWEILAELKKRGSTIIISTPYMDEVELSERAIFLYEGKKLAEGPPGDLIQYFNGRVYQVDMCPTSELMKKLRQVGGFEVRRFGAVIHVYTPPDRDIGSFAEPFNSLGIEPHSIKEIDPDLEDVFIQLMER